MRSVIGWVRALLGKRTAYGGRKKAGGDSGKKDQAFSQVDEAKQEWLAALSLFHNVSEEELIDHAIYALNAAERRYFFLLKKSRLLSSFPSRRKRNNKKGSG